VFAGMDQTSQDMSFHENGLTTDLEKLTFQGLNDKMPVTNNEPIKKRRLDPTYEYAETTANGCPTNTNTSSKRATNHDDAIDLIPEYQLYVSGSTSQKEEWASKQQGKFRAQRLWNNGRHQSVIRWQHGVGYIRFIKCKPFIKLIKLQTYG
jgi:hypothetical protein